MHYFFKIVSSTHVHRSDKLGIYMMTTKESIKFHDPRVQVLVLGHNKSYNENISLKSCLLLEIGQENWVYSNDDHGSVYVYQNGKFHDHLGRGHLRRRGHNSHVLKMLNFFKQTRGEVGKVKINTKLGAGVALNE